MPRVRRHVVVLAVLVVALCAVAATVVVLVNGGDGEGERSPNPAATSAKHGTLLSQETIRTGLSAGVKGWRIVYATTDQDGRGVRASAVVLVSEAEPTVPTAGGRPVLSIGHGTSGIRVACAPSRARAFSMAAPALMVSLLEQGWILVQSDYIGLGQPGLDGVHPYLDGASEGHAVLDATLAARHLEGLGASSRTVLFGASQGGHAVLFAGAQAPSYAPDLDLLGVAAAAPATDLRFLVRDRPRGAAAFVVSAYVAVSWNALHPDAHVPDHVSDWALAKQVARGCGPQATVAAVRSGATGPLFDADALEGQLGKVFDSNVPQAPIDAPVLVGQGLADPIVPAAMQAEWVRQRCAAGQHLTYRTFAGLTHSTIVAATSPFTSQLADWLDARLLGRPATPTC